MPTLPIPLISSILLGFLLLQMWLRDRRHGSLVFLLALCAMQGVIISMAQHYRVPGMLVLQPMTATLIPAASWIAFQTTAIRRFQTSDYIHLLGPLCALLALVTVPVFLDTLIPALFLGYGAAILWTGTRGADSMPRMRLEAGDLPSQVWQVIGAALIGSAFSDVLIVAAQMLDAAYLQPWIISLYSSLMLLIIGGLSLSSALVTAPEENEEATAETVVSDHDVQIVERLNAMMHQQKLYLNPDLTLSQLSRKVVIPVKQLSGAINRVTGENVSRYINAARIGAAQEALKAGENVTNAMLSSGFNTKSNFNREFLRVAGQNPSDWLESQN